MNKRQTKARKYMITCAYCGKQVEKSNRQETCSMECRSALRRQRQLDGASTGECPVCHETKTLPFKVYEYHVCSDECKNVLLARYWRQNYGVDSEWYSEYVDRKRLERILPPKQKNCLDCGQPLTGMKRMFCSQNCKRRYYNHHAEHQASSAVSKRGKRKAIEIDESCALCGVRFSDIPTPEDVGFRGFSSYALKTKFHIDHIIPVSAGGSDEPGNLRLLCWMCNHVKNTLDSSFDKAVKEASTAFWKSYLGNT